MSKELLVGPFSKLLNKEEREEFLKYFGAVDVKHLSKKYKELYSVARFNSDIDCEYALRKLHQVDLFGVRISARFYDSYRLLKQGRNCQGYFSKDKGQKVSLKNALLNYEAQLSSISSNFNVRNPLSPKLRYSYPTPTPEVLCNIAHAIVAVPKFYTQVLHLMNKMNLPCPFGPLTEEPPICKEAKSRTKVFTIKVEKKSVGTMVEPVVEEEESLQLETESESEIESDEEIKSMFVREKSNIKRTLRTQPKKIIKRPKLEALMQSLLVAKENSNLVPKDDSMVLQEVFEMPSLNPKRTLNVNVQSTSFTINTNPEEDVVTEGFGKLYPPTKEKDNTEETEKFSHFISLEELSKNRISKADWPIVPVFKNYILGTPSIRIYIKNLAKTVTESDLRFIFNRYLSSRSEEDSQLIVRLMKDGRMKGQAFITFSSESVAAKAIEEVNGYILKDKPMVIVFGKVKPSD